MGNLNAAAGHDLGLEDYQLELLVQLAAQADERGIPREVLPILAKYVDRIDFDRLVVTATGASEILRVSDRQVDRLIETNFEWMAPFVTTRDRAGDVVSRVWLKARVAAFQRWRKK